MNEIKKLLLYAGLDREEYDTLTPDAHAENAKNLRIYALLTTLVFFGLIIANAAVYDLTSINQAHYLLMAFVNLFVYVCTRFLVPKRPETTVPLCYVFMGMLYAFSLSLTILHPDMPSVTTIVLLFAVPFLVCDRPIRLIFMTVAVAVGLCLVALTYKSASIAHMDVWNALSFAAVAISVETLQQRSKFRMLSQARKIRHMSETDLLTGAKNRNYYEEHQAEYPDRCQRSLVCLYADVNGLHELNDTQGHHAGDVMLQTVAAALIECFGAEHTYRIGGDEFVCMRPDGSETETRQDAARIASALAAQQYNISVGIASAEKPDLDMAAMTAAAEGEMYQAKRAYYQQTGRDRRRR